MGFLNGQFGGAGQAAQNSLGWGTASTGLDTVGALMSGFGGFQQGQYQAQVARNNAAIATQNANQALQAGSYEESASKLRTGLTIGAEKAAQGANNIDVNVGSPVQVRASTATIGAMDAAMIHYNAAKQAYGDQIQATSANAQSRLDQMSAVGSLVGGGFKAASSLLSGASSLSSKWANYSLQFPNSTSQPSVGGGG